MKKLLFFVWVMVFFLLSCCVFAEPYLPIPTPTPQIIYISDNSIFNAITDLPLRIFTSFLEKFSQIINDFVGNAMIANIQFYLEQFMSFIRNGDPVFGDPTVGLIYNIIRPVGYSLILLFFVLGLSKNAIYFEAMSWEVILKAGLMLVVGKYLIDFGKDILQIICDANTSLCIAILNSTNTNISEVFNLNGSYSSAFAGVSNIQQAISSQLLFIIFAVIALLSAITVFLVLIFRQVQLAVLICASPLFFATIVADISNDVFKSFIKQFFAVAFQTTFMSIALAIFCGSIKSFLIGSAVGVGGGFIGLLVGLIGLSFYMVKTPNTIKSILGVGDGGAGLSIASIAGLFK